MQRGLAVLLNLDILSNDGGIILGQAAIAALILGNST